MWHIRETLSEQIQSPFGHNIKVNLTGLLHDAVSMSVRVAVILKLLGSDELEAIWKEAIVTELRCCACTCLECLRQHTITITCVAPGFRTDASGIRSCSLLGV
jgi:hypothetical protein